MSTFKSVTTTLAEMKHKYDTVKREYEAVKRDYEAEVNQVLVDYRQSVLPLTDEFFESRLEYLTLKDIRSNDYAKYALEFVFQGNLEIIDYARKKGRYMDASGEFTTDLGLQDLSTRFFKVLSIGVQKFLCDYYNSEEYKLMKDYTKQRRDWEQKSVNLLNDAVNGDASLFTKKFIIAICRGCK
jgi:hypothetical protein